jgi:hypothetical protein
MKAGINMGETFVHINVSLDGYIERENHDIEWQFVDDDFEESPRHICLGLRGSSQHHVDDGSGRCGRALWGWGRG